MRRFFKFKEIFILFAVSLLIMIPFWSNNYVTGDDTDFHMSNIFAILVTMANGNSSLSEILPVIGHDFGYGTGIFYPALSHIVSAYMSLIFLGNITAGLKAVHFLVYFFSALMMYKLVNRVFKNKFVAVIAGIFYITFPYSITEVFRRDALAESFIYLFMPMIVLGLYELFSGNKKAFYIWFIIGYIGIINSHLVLSVYFTAFVLIYLIINIKKVFTKENFIPLLLASIAILLITAPFTVPILQHKALGIYHAFESDSMSNIGTITNSKMYLWEFIVQKTSEKFTSINYYLNLLALMLAIVGIVRFKKIVKDDKKEKNFFLFLVIMSVVAIIMMSQIFPWEYLPKLLVMIQFAWRLEAILIFALSILAALALRNIQSKKAKIIWMVIILVFNGYTVYNTYDFDKIKEHNIEDINVSYWGMGYEKEYLPEVTIQNIDYYDNRGNEIIVNEESDAKVNILEDQTPYLKAEIIDCTETTILELPRIYYLGYKAILIDNDGNEEELNIYMNGNGFIETAVDKSGTLVLTYEGTILSNIAQYCCVITVFVLIMLLLTQKRNKIE